MLPRVIVDLVIPLYVMVLDRSVIPRLWFFGMGALRITTDKGSTTYESREEAILAYNQAHARGEHPILSVSSEYEEPPDSPVRMTALD